MKLIFLIAASCLAGSVFATNEAYALNSMRAMEKVFRRSEEMHHSSMAAISKRLASPEAALEVLHATNQTSPALLQVANMAISKNTNLRKKPKKSIDGARKMLNGMIYESASKYDGEIAKCTEFYSKQCALMQAARGEIAASNYIAASSRMSILDSQGTIGRYEEEIPVKKLELAQNGVKCKHELQKMHGRLEVILQDIAVMTAILKMTDCDVKSMVQEVGLMQCEDPCHKTSFISFKHTALQKQFSQLKSALSHKLTKEAMTDFFDGVNGIQSLEFLAQPAIGNKTDFNNPPKPRTQVAANPCSDPNMGAPSAATKRAAKCTLGKSPQCYKLQERFLLIQSGIEDERDELMDEIAKTEGNCEEAANTLGTQVKNAQNSLGNSQTKLAMGTESEANAAETSRQTSKSFNAMNKELLETMKTCSTNYINFETELCALKKIRGELYKMKGSSGAALFFVDCSVGPWEQEECSKECAGGEMKLTRSVVTHSNRGAKCLPLSARTSCNDQPCPVSCKLHAWSGWSKCSAQCGGGVQQRLRDVKQAMKFGGKPCGAISETKPCAAQSCEKDCKLGRWSKWSECTKDCDGGTQKRIRFVKDKAVGEGFCPDIWASERLQYKKCNMKRCFVSAKTKVLECQQELDVVLLMDGSGSLGQDGWDAQMKAVKLFISAFEGEKNNAQLSIIVFSGPKTWSGVDRCMGKGSAQKNVNMEKCGILTVTHFEGDMKKVREKLTGEEGPDWPKGSTLTSLALSTAKAELNLGRKDARSVVIVFTDGRPLSYRKTFLAARELRKSARLIWVPITKRAPLAFIKKVATRRWQENVVLAKGYSELESPDTVNHIVANMCPKLKQAGAAVAPTV